jgi:quinol monooxygenase YgiN
MNDVDEGRPEDAETGSATSANGASSPGSEVAMAPSSAVIEFKGGTMMSAFEVRARLKVRDGQLEAFKRHAAEMMRQTREKDTGTLAYDWFLSNDGTECEVHEAYVDPDALVEHAPSTSAKLGRRCSPHPPTTTRWPSTATRRLGSWSWWTRSGWTSRPSPSSRRSSPPASTEGPGASELTDTCRRSVGGGR